MVTPTTPGRTMTDTTPSTLIDLGTHALEITEGGVLIAAHPTDSGPVPVLQLDRDEAYKLLIALQALFV